MPEATRHFASAAGTCRLPETDHSFGGPRCKAANRRRVETTLAPTEPADELARVRSVTPGGGAMGALNVSVRACAAPRRGVSASLRPRVASASANEK